MCLLPTPILRIGFSSAVAVLLLFLTVVTIWQNRKTTESGYLGQRAFLCLAGVLFRALFYLTKRYRVPGAG